jgi:O-antigen ligase
MPEHPLDAGKLAAAPMAPGPAAGGRAAPLRESAAEAFGQLGTAVFAFLAFCSPYGALAGFGLAALALVASREARSALAADPVQRLAAFTALCLVARAAWATAEFPEALDLQLKSLGRWLLCLGFPAVAWWLGGNPGRARAALLAAFAGLVLGLLAAARRPDLLVFRIGRQTGFQMPAECAGLVSATALLGLLLFSGAALKAPVGKWGRALRLAFFAVGLYLMAYMLVASQSRISWIALLVVGLGVAVPRFRRGRGQPAKLPIFPVLALALVAGGIALNTEAIRSRIAPDREVATKILRGETADLPVSSFRYRFAVQRFGFEKWLERPVFGWGPGSTHYLIRNSGRTELINQTAGGRWMGQLHNTYLEVLLQFGLAGAALFLALGWRLIRAAARAKVRQRLPEDLFLFATGSMGILAIWATSSYGLMVDDWPHWWPYWILLMGLAYSFFLPAGTIIR